MGNEGILFRVDFRNAFCYFRNMETVFDFNPSNEELRALFFDLETAEEVRREYKELQPLGFDPCIVFLLIGRQQWAEAKKYAKKADDPSMRLDLLADIAKAEEGARLGETLV